MKPLVIFVSAVVLAGIAVNKANDFEKSFQNEIARRDPFLTLQDSDIGQSSNKVLGAEDVAVDNLSLSNLLFPNALILSKDESTIILTTHESYQNILDWYKNKLITYGYSKDAFISKKEKTKFSSSFKSSSEKEGVSILIEELNISYSTKITISRI